MTERHNWLPSQAAIEASNAHPLEQFDKALALATTKHRHQVAGASDWHEKSSEAITTSVANAISAGDLAIRSKRRCLSRPN